MTRTFTTLITADELLALAARGPAPVVVDCSFDLADTEAGERAWREAHLPGSHYLHLDRDLSGAKTGRNGRHPLPDRAAFAARMAELGCQDDLPVVAYDASGGMYAARLWWMLRWLGHSQVQVLDGEDEQIRAHVQVLGKPFQISDLATLTAGLSRARIAESHGDEVRDSSPTQQEHPA